MSSEFFLTRNPKELFGSSAGGKLESVGISRLAKIERSIQEIIESAEVSGFKINDYELGGDGPESRFVTLKKWFADQYFGKLYCLYIETDFDQNENVWIWDKDFLDIKSTLNL